MINFSMQDIDNTVYERLLKPLEAECRKNIKKLDKIDIKHTESIGLLIQAFNTIKNSEKNLKQFNFVDANFLLRASLEYIVIAYMIDADENVYNEFLILSNNDVKIERKYTVINTLIQEFAKKLNKISPIIFNETTNKERKKLVIDLYDLLCKYTHASIVVSIFKEIKDEKEKEVLKIILSYNLYLVKFILLDCLRYFINDNKEDIDEDTIGFCILLSIIKIGDIIQKNNIDFAKFKKFLYYDTVNSKFFIFFEKEMEKFKLEVSNAMNDLKGNEDIIEKLISDFII